MCTIHESYPQPDTSNEPVPVPAGTTRESLIPGACLGVSVTVGPWPGMIVSHHKTGDYGYWYYFYDPEVRIGYRWLVYTPEGCWREVGGAV